jgi:pimeloyl-ACP methyl ester carboxylesterase
MKTEQRAVRFTCCGTCLIGVVDVPERPLGRGVLIVPRPWQYRAGLHRQHTLLSRRLAPRGIATLRFDARGAGDSEGPSRPAAALAEDLACARREFTLVVPEVQEVVLWAMGEAASAAALYASTDARVRGLVLINPVLRAPAQPYAPERAPQPARVGELAFWTTLNAAGQDFAHTMATLRQQHQRTAADGTAPLARRVAASLDGFDGRLLVLLAGAPSNARLFTELLDRHHVACERHVMPHALPSLAARAWRDEMADTTANWIASW